MKVVLTHEIFMPDFHGGGEMVAYKLAKGLMDAGIELKVLTCGDPKIKSYDGIETIRLPINRYLMNFADFWIKKHISDADIVQTTNYNACYPTFKAAKSLGKPVVNFIFGMYGKENWIKMRGPIFGSFSASIEKVQISHDFDRFVFLSDFAMQKGVEIGIPKNKSVIISPGIDQEKYSMGKKENYVLFTGRFAKQKGVYDIIEVAKKLPDVKFKLAGYGEEEKNMRKIATPNIEILNITHKDGKPFFDLYSKASVFFLPSVAETFGIVILEAMASGCPVVSTVPLDYSGVTVKQGDVNAMANVIKKYMNNPNLVLSHGKDNVKKAKKYTWTSFTKGFIKLYNEILE